MKIDEAIKGLSVGNIGVIMSDTVFGLVADARNPDAVNKIYLAKKRDSRKPCIILIHTLADLDIFHIVLTPRFRKFLEKIWPKAVTVILRLEPEYYEQFAYLHRGTGELTFRMPDDVQLQKILAQTGPLIAPSANTEGEKPAETVDEIKNYFQDSVDIYVTDDDKPQTTQPSTIIKIKQHKIHVIREGAVPVSWLEDVWTQLLVDDYSDVPNEARRE